MTIWGSKFHRRQVNGTKINLKRNNVFRKIQILDIYFKWLENKKYEKEIPKGVCFANEIAPSTCPMTSASNSESF